MRHPGNAKVGILSQRFLLAEFGNCSPCILTFMTFSSYAEQCFCSTEARLRPVEVLPESRSAYIGTE